MIGVLALQGGVREHVDMLVSLGAQTRLVRRAQDLDGLAGMVLPGGESSTLSRLLRLFDLTEPLREAIRGGLPTLGTCAGLVLLARGVLDAAPGQESLGILDVDVRRNAFGSQVDSAEVDLPTTLGPTKVAFIRAPELVRVGPGVEMVASRGERAVAVRQGHVIGIAFHPELTGDTTFHRALLGAATENRRTG